MGTGAWGCSLRVARDGCREQEYQRKGLDGDGWMNESAQSAEAAEWMAAGTSTPRMKTDARIER